MKNLKQRKRNPLTGLLLFKKRFPKVSYFRATWLVSLLLLILIAGTFLYFYRSDQRRAVSIEPGAMDSHELGVLDMEGGNSTTPKDIETETALQSEFRRVLEPYKIDVPTEVYEKYYDNLGADRILKVLEERPYCHSEAHNLGRVIFNKTQNFTDSVSICANHCSTGCFHGVLMAALADHKDGHPSGLENAHVTVDGVSSKLTQLCEGSKVKQEIGYGTCVHGVGHAISKLTGNDIETSLKTCAAYSMPGEQYYCATGVFMERDIELGEEDQLISPLYPCDQVDFPAACYRYKLRRVFKDTPATNVNVLCSHLTTESQRQGCFHGLGFGFFGSVMKDPQSLGSLCHSDNKTEKQLCLEGVVGIAMISQRERTVQACRTLALEDQELCWQGMRVGNFGMNRDFSLYYKKL